MGGRDPPQKYIPFYHRTLSSWYYTTHVTLIQLLLTSTIGFLHTEVRIERGDVGFACTWKGLGNWRRS